MLCQECLVILFHDKCKCPGDLQSFCKKKKKKWELLDYFSWVLGTTNGIISVFWKMSSSHATIPGKIHLGNTGIYKDPSGLLKNIVVGILLKHVY